MRDAAVSFLEEYGISGNNLIVKQVPGSFELIYGAIHAFENDNVDGIIVIGCVIQGETPHFTFISQAVASGIAELNISYQRPVIFGVLTTLDLDQAKARAGGKHGNKGTEAAASLVKMLNF
jgi:6,7-dimethyl-8-ribityllumazine synthase